VEVEVNEAVGDGVAVSVGAGVEVAVGSGVILGTSVGDGVAEGVLVGDEVWVGLGVGVIVGVDEGVGERITMRGVGVAGSGSSAAGEDSDTGDAGALAPWAIAAGVARSAAVGEAAESARGELS
jgi:hypothetical protein